LTTLHGAQSGCTVQQVRVPTVKHQQPSCCSSSRCHCSGAGSHFASNAAGHTTGWHLSAPVSIPATCIGPSCCYTPICRRPWVPGTSRTIPGQALLGE
jgi:hypothetical protein